ncbi:MAG: thioredoxin domain-containing protein [Propionibacteriales bacterium]|nr:thioredoxin domain-containing protein [Propionibacteriales bacterium]
MDRNLKIALIIGAIVAAVVGYVLYQGGDDVPAAGGPDAADQSELLTPEARMLSDAENTDVAFVEFLDFECPGCASLYPLVEDLRQEYGDRLDFAIRYLPLDMHPNAVPAAAAVEAAHRIGDHDAFLRMYQLMFSNQSVWAGEDDPDEIFRGYAREIGLDVEEFDRLRGSEQVLGVVNRSGAQAAEIGVEGTPTMFLDGERLDPESEADLRASLDEAVAR